MPRRTALLMLALAASLCVPIAAALTVDAVEPVSALGDVMPAQPDAAVANDAVPVLPILPSLPDVPLVGADLAQISIQGQAKAVVSVQSGPDDSAATPPQSDGAAASRPSIGAQVASVAAPVAGSAILAALVGALALGVEGLRNLQTRISGQFGKFGRVLVGLMPAMFLFSRIERGALLDNPVRARVHDVVTQDPGLSLSEVRARTGIAWGTAVHHLRRLEDHGMVVSVNLLAHRRYFAANTPAASQRTALAVVIHPTARRIAQLVIERPGIDQSGICQALGLNNPAASKHLRQFEAQGLVHSHRSGRSRFYRPTDALGSALRLLEPAPLMVSVPSYAMAVQRVPGASST